MRHPPPQLPELYYLRNFRTALNWLSERYSDLLAPEETEFIDSFALKYESGREGDMPLVGFSPRKPATVFYGLIASENAKQLLSRLGKHTTGKGCLYIKKLSDVDLKVLQELIMASVATKSASQSRGS